MLKNDPRVSNYFNEDMLNKFIDISRSMDKGRFVDSPKELFALTFEG